MWGRFDLCLWSRYSRMDCSDCGGLAAHLDSGGGCEGDEKMVTMKTIAPNEFLKGFFSGIGTVILILLISAWVF